MELTLEMEWCWQPFKIGQTRVWDMGCNPQHISMKKYAFGVMSIFGSTYLCEQLFTAMLKTHTAHALQTEATVKMNDFLQAWFTDAVCKSSGAEIPVEINIYVDFLQTFIFHCWERRCSFFQGRKQGCCGHKHKGSTCM